MKNYGELIKALRECCDVDDPVARKLFRESADAITDLQRDNAELTAKVAQYEAENRWVPVSESLPENGQYVLALCVMDDDKTDTTYSLAAFMEDEWQNDYGHSVKDYLCTTVTHWRPLPKFEQEAMG